MLWVESGLTMAQALIVQDRPAIVICRGFFDVVHYQTALSHLTSLLIAHDDALSKVLIADLPPSQLMNMAGYVVLADAYAILRQPATSADLLGPNALKAVDFGVSTSMALLLLHELGHIALGHVTAGPPQAQYVEAPADNVARAQMEFDADAFSVKAIASEWRGHMLSSLINLHNIFQFFEVFGVRGGPDYPTADTRLAALLPLLNLEEKDARFADGWLADYAQRTHDIASGRVEPADMIARFDATMTAEAAYAHLNRLRTAIHRVGVTLDLPE